MDVLEEPPTTRSLTSGPETLARARAFSGGPQTLSLNQPSTPCPGSSEAPNLPDDNEARDEHLARIGSLWPAVVHDIRNQINVVKTAGYFLNTRIGNSDPRLARHLELIDNACSRAAQILNELSDFASRSPVLHPGNVRTVVAQSMRAFSFDVARIEFEAAEALPTVLLDEVLLSLAVRKLLQNALTRTAAETTIYLRLWAEGDRVWISLDDDGPPIPEAQRETMFNPIAASRKATHLELALVGQVVTAHGGRGHCSVTADGGSRIEIDLPISSAPSP